MKRITSQYGEVELTEEGGEFVVRCADRDLKRFCDTALRFATASGRLGGYSPDSEQTAAELLADKLGGTVPPAEPMPLDPRAVY